MIKDSEQPRYILLVDDYETLRTSIKEWLNAIGFSVITAGNGREAIQIIDQMDGQISLLITDINMPVLDGLSLIHHVRQFDSALPIVVITGFQEEAALNQIEDMHIVRFNKPLDLSALEGHLNCLWS